MESFVQKIKAMKYKPSPKHSVLLQDAHSKIIRLEAQQNYTLFFLNNGKTNLMSYNLKKYQDFFNYPFVRVSRSSIVNLTFCSGLSPETKKISLSDGTEVQISRRRFEKIKVIFLS